jgi:hypothetical protein
MTKWKLDDALLNEMACEMALEAEARAEGAEKALQLVEMLAPTVAAMARTGATREQIAAVLRYFAAGACEGRY